MALFIQILTHSLHVQMTERLFPNNLVVDFSLSQDIDTLLIEWLLHQEPLNFVPRETFLLSHDVACLDPIQNVFIIILAGQLDCVIEVLVSDIRVVQVS